MRQTLSSHVHRQQHHLLAQLMQARLDFHRRLVVQPRCQEIDTLEDQLAGKADAVWKFIQRSLGEFHEFTYRMRAEGSPVFGRNAMPPAIRNVILKR